MRNKFRFNGNCMNHYPGSYPKRVGQYPTQQPSPGYPTQPQQMQYQPPGQYGAPGQVYGVPPPPYNEAPLQPAPSGMYNVSYKHLEHLPKTSDNEAKSNCQVICKIHRTSFSYFDSEIGARS